tara:strand:- start:458 stop:664 length:207 start_codon:yes stop_codon:yes gene_type:complete
LGPVLIVSPFRYLIGATIPQSALAARGGTHRDYPMFNNRRLLEPIGNIPPAEAEERYYATLDASALAA